MMEGEGMLVVHQMCILAKVDIGERDRETKREGEREKCRFCFVISTKTMDSNIGLGCKKMMEGEGKLVVHQMRILAKVDIGERDRIGEGEKVKEMGDWRKGEGGKEGERTLDIREKVKEKGKVKEER